MRPKMKIEKMAEFFGQLISSKNLKKGREKKSFAPCVETETHQGILPPSLSHYSGAEPSGGQQPRRGASERKKTGERKGQVPSPFFLRTCTFVAYLCVTKSTPPAILRAGARGQFLSFLRFAVPSGGRES